MPTWTDERGGLRENARSDCRRSTQRFPAPHCTSLRNSAVPAQSHSHF